MAKVASPPPLIAAYRPPVWFYPRRVCQASAPLLYFRVTISKNKRDYHLDAGRQGGSEKAAVGRLDSRAAGKNSLIIAAEAATFLGNHQAPAANEPGFRVECALYQVALRAGDQLHTTQGLQADDELCGAELSAAALWE